ncbi:hypothetical protein VPH35_113420 [Triticum aestivum]
MRGSSLVFAVALLFAGSLMFGECRHVSHQDRRANVTATATTAGSASSGSKISVNWCYRRDCNSRNGQFYWHQCWCCPLLRDEPCWKHVEECHATCPTCHPKC